MLIKHRKTLFITILTTFSIFLTACSHTKTQESSGKESKPSKIYAPKQKSRLNDPIMAVSRLSEQQQEWKGTRYRLGGISRKGVDCSGFMQITFRDLFGIKLPRTTVEQAKQGRRIPKSEIRTGDLVFFNTGRGPNGKHVGVYVKNGQFLHASTRGGIIYSDMNSPYWSKTFWQARRL